jgi:hypothetical protein
MNGVRVVEADLWPVTHLRHWAFKKQFLRSQ